MTAIDYHPNHYESVSSWFEKRGLPPIPAESLPSVGKIVPGIGAIFLYQTDSDVCLLESAITNPEAHKDVRTQAIDVVTAACIERAKEFGFKTMLSVTKNKKILDQSKAHGFVELDGEYKLIERNLWVD